MSVKWKTLAAVLLILAGAGVAGAGTLGLTFTGDSPTRLCTMDPPPPGYSTSQQFYIGQSNFTVDLSQTASDAAGELLAEAMNHPTAPGSSIGMLSGYCIDTYQTIGIPHPDMWTVVNLTAWRASAPTSLPGVPTLGTDLTKVLAKVADLQGLFARHGLTANPTPDEAAAMGAAVWEIVNETGSYGLSDGSFKVYQASGNWAGMATEWLGALTMPIGAPTPKLYALVDPQTQDFVIAIEGSGGTPVPEPFTMLTASLAIGGLGMYVRRRSGRSSGLAG